MPLKRDRAVVAFKPCPKCGGTGQVPCNGTEHIKAQHESWAQEYHHRAVKYKWDHHEVVGVAEAEKRRGGWWGLRVYVAVTDVPPGCREIEPGRFTAWGIDASGVPHHVVHSQGIGLWDFAIMNGKALWYLPCGYWRRNDVELLAVRPDCLKEAWLALGEAVEREE